MIEQDEIGALALLAKALDPNAVFQTAIRTDKEDEQMAQQRMSRANPLLFFLSLHIGLTSF